MNMDIIYYIILGVTVVSYLLGLFLSHFEKKGDVSVLSNMGNQGFVNIFGVSSVPSKSMRGFTQEEIQFQQEAQMAQHPFQTQQEVEDLQQIRAAQQHAQQVIQSSYMDDEII